MGGKGEAKAGSWSILDGKWGRRRKAVDGPAEKNHSGNDGGGCDTGGVNDTRRGETRKKGDEKNKTERMTRGRKGTFLN